MPLFNAFPNTMIFNEGVIITTSTDFALTTATGTLLVDCSGGPRIVTLPTSVGNNGKRFVIKKIDDSGNIATIDAAGSETIDDQLTQTLDAQGEAIIIQSTGSGWTILSVN